MAKLSITSKTSTGKAGKPVDLNEAIFGIEPNKSVMHQVVVAQMAAARQGTHSTKTRSEVRGGGAKPWRQKGTGRARQGSIRSPQWRGGGIAHGPKPRSYAQRTPKKMVKLALFSALSDRLADENVTVIEDFKFDKPSTKSAVEILEAAKLRPEKDKWPSVLLILTNEEENEVLSFRNIPQVQIILVNELNAYDILSNDHLVFSKDAIELAQKHFTQGRGSNKAETKKQTDKPETTRSTTTESKAGDK